MQHAKDPADVIREASRLIGRMEKERAALETRFDKAYVDMGKAEDEWRSLGAKIREKVEKIKGQKDRQQEALSRSPQQDPTKG